MVRTRLTGWEGEDGIEFDNIVGKTKSGKGS